MPAFIRRICDSFVQHSPWASTKSSPRTTSPQGRRRSSYEPHFSDEEGDPRSDDIETGPPPLTVIRDMGPPDSGRYVHPDIFWNSVMIEADEAHKDWRGMKLPGDDQGGAAESRRAGSAKASLDTEARWSKVNGIAKEDPEIAASRQRPRDNHDFRKREQNVSYGKERADNGLIVMHFAIPECHSRSPILSERPGADVPVAPGTAITTADSDRCQVQLKDLERSQRSDITWDEHKSAPPTETALTWNMCLEQILHRESVDPNMKELVDERVRNSSTTNGHDEDHQVSIREAGLVPNSSYPVARSRFFDQLAPEASPPLALHTAVHDGPVATNHLEQEQLTSTKNRWQEFDFSCDPSRRTPSSSSSQPIAHLPQQDPTTSSKA
jgi:hypothetical protein